MATYIQGSSCISPQYTFDRQIFTNGLLQYQENRLKAIEPVYTDFIDSKLLRRMSKVIKMGVTASILALKDAKVEIPTGILTGTTLGCIEDTDTFIKKLVGNNEELLNPSAFIHSTHNTISGQIALLFQCRGYNTTYVHKSQSFESALLDAVILLEENPDQQLLTGGIDECTDTSFSIMDRMGFFKKNESLQTNLYSGNTRGSLSGEGAAYFLLSGQKSDSSFAKILDVQSYNCISSSIASDKLSAWLMDRNIQPDLLVSGHNGDVENDKICDEVGLKLGLTGNSLKYKHLCGEYGTASGFGMWLAGELLRDNKLVSLFSEKHFASSINTVILHNTNHGHHNFIILQGC